MFFEALVGAYKLWYSSSMNLPWQRCNVPERGNDGQTSLHEDYTTCKKNAHRPYAGRYVFQTIHGVGTAQRVSRKRTLVSQNLHRPEARLGDFPLVLVPNAVRCQAALYSNLNDGVHDFARI